MRKLFYLQGAYFSYFVFPFFCLFFPSLPFTHIDTNIHTCRVFSPPNARLFVSAASTMVRTPLGSLCQICLMNYTWPCVDLTSLISINAELTYTHTHPHTHVEHPPAQHNKHTHTPASTLTHKHTHTDTKAHR